MSIIAFVPDLMDRSKVAAVAPSAVFVAQVGDIPALAAEGPARLVVFDLGRPGAIEAMTRVAASGIATIGFASHVDRALLAAARAAGGGQVLARSVFFRRLDELLGS